MPLVRHRDNLSDLIRKGGERKSNFKDERIKHSELILRKLPVLDAAGTVIKSEEDITLMLRVSSGFLYYVELPFKKITRFIAIILAFTIVLTETSGQRDSDQLRGAAIVLEYICDVYYILDGGAKLLSIYAYREIVHNHFYHKIGNMAYIRRSGVVDLAVAIASLVYLNDLSVSRWIHLVRCACISLFYLEQLPQIDVLSSGISAGLTSTMYTWLLMTVTFLVYSAAGVIFFRDNDPYHFGDMSTAMWTYFEMGTLDNWADVLNINYWGCSEYSADYYVNGTGHAVISTGFGNFYLPVCWKPKASPASASLFFVSFILICGFILVSLTVAFVTTGINTRLHELQHEEDLEELKKEMGAKKKINFPTRKKKTAQKTSPKTAQKTAQKTAPNENKDRIPQEGGGEEPALRRDDLVSFKSDISNKQDDSSAKLHTSSKHDLNEVKNLELLRQLLKQVWKGDNNIVKAEQDLPFDGSNRRASTMARDPSFRGGKKRGSVMRLQKELLQFGLQMRQITSDKNYKYFIYVTIIFAAVVELLSIENLISRTFSDVASILCQVVFTVDLFIKFFSCAPNYVTFIQNSWNLFDALLVALLWIPIALSGNNSYFELLKVLRIIRVLKMLSFIQELNVIIQSISTSARCLAYVIMFMLVFFFHFGAAGVFLFSKNDPFHFSDLGRAMLTLFQVSTLDNWADIARLNMYGCRYVGYDPEFCDLNDSKGYGWLAAWYFVIFVIVGVMVLVALFIGVIITSMELLHTSIHEEAEMLKKVRAKQAEFNISDATCSTLLEIFDLIDVCANGRLTLNELKPVLAMVSLGENQQYELFHKIDEDASGKIDFAEFCELIKLMGEAYSANNPATPLKDNMTKVRILGKLGMKTRGILPFYSSKRGGWGAVTAGAMIQKEMLAPTPPPPGGKGGGMGSPTAAKPSARQVSTFKRKSVLLAAARIESAKMETERMQKESAARRKAAAAAVAAADLLADDRSPTTRMDSSHPPPSSAAPVLPGNFAAVLKNRSQKASSAVASKHNASNEGSTNAGEAPTVDTVLSPSGGADVSPFVETIDNNYKEEVLTPSKNYKEEVLTPSKNSDNRSSAMSRSNKVHIMPLEAELGLIPGKSKISPKVKESIASKTVNLNDNGAIVELKATDNLEELNQAVNRNGDSERFLFGSSKSKPSRKEVELYSPQDMITASMFRFPSDDSVVSSKKYKLREHNNSTNVYDRFADTRRHRSGPISSSIYVRPKGVLEMLEESKNSPNLFFDYNGGSDDGIELGAEALPKKRPRGSSRDRSHRRDRSPDQRPVTRG